MNLRNQDLAEAVKNGPMYVQLALDPLYYQFYTATCEDPMHAAYYNAKLPKDKTRPTLAGVLTGFDFRPDQKHFWEVYIRRHTTGDATKDAFANRVLLKPTIKDADGNYLVDKNGDLLKPFAGITATAYSVSVDKATKNLGAKGRVDMAVIAESDLPAGRVTDNASLKEVVKTVYTEEEMEAATTVTISSIIFPKDATMSDVNFKEVFPNLKELTFDVTPVTDPTTGETMNMNEEELLMLILMMQSANPESFEDITLSFVTRDTTGGRRLALLDPEHNSVKIDMTGFRIGSLFIGKNLFSLLRYTVILKGSRSRVE